ncbi:MAG: phosphatase PAP2 family protein [Candidatus Zhuqueibacterota bacterium]
MNLFFRIRSRLTRLWLESVAPLRLKLVDINCLGYPGLIAVLLLFFHDTVDNWATFILLHFLVIALILFIVRQGERQPNRQMFVFLRTFYPIAVLAFCWSEIGATSRMFFSDYWATEAIISLDRLVFGVSPTAWFQQFYRPWLDELMNLFYSGFFLFMPVVSLTLYFQDRKQDALAAFSLGTFIHLSNFMLFRLFPTLAPFMTESIASSHPQQYTGYLFAEITRITQSHGAQPGGTFPSVHVSTAIGWALIAFHFERRWGFFLIPAAIGVAISTVYLGYHHALDAVFGFLWGILAFLIALKILKRRNEDRPSETPSDFPAGA